MTRTPLTASCFALRAPARYLFGTVVGLALLAGCGGGGSGGSNSDEPETASASSLTRGSISGFGSVIVNGVRFDDAAAVVEDDDGAKLKRDDLRLGMEVEIEGGKISEGRGSAQRIRIGSALVGAVQSVDAAAGTLTLLDQTIVVASNTVFDDDLKGALAALKVGDVLEVHAQFDAASGRYTATRIDDEDDDEAYKLKGVVSSLDRTAKTFRIGNALISYAGVAAADQPKGLADGKTVRLKLRTVQEDGAWVVAGLRDNAPKVEDHDEAELHGRITAFTSSAAFSVDGIEVDAVNARFSGGQSGLALGAEVEVEGSLVAGVLVANGVEVDRDDDDDRDDDNDNDNDRDDDDGFELHGAIGSLDSAAKTFVLRGVTVSYAGSVRYEEMRADQLADGLKVEVEGRLSADGSTVAATHIELDD